MNPAYVIRPATLTDVEFLSNAIIGAELSGTGTAGLAALFGLGVAQARQLVVAMLNEEIDGCEFSVSSFLIAGSNGEAVAAVAGWLEGDADDMPSSILKSNLIGFTFPPESLRIAQERRNAITGIQIEREKGSLQIEYVYVDPAHRGHDLAGHLIQEHISRAVSHFPMVRKAQVQVFANNAHAIRIYERLGFAKVRAYRANSPDALDLLPWNEKLLLERPLN